MPAESVAVPMPGRDLLVNAWYTARVDIIDFTEPRNPREIAFYDLDGDNWSAYWYEHGSPHPGAPLRIYASDGVRNPAIGAGLQAFVAAVSGRRIGLDHLNPQTQERDRKTPRRRCAATSPVAAASRPLGALARSPRSALEGRARRGSSPGAMTRRVGPPPGGLTVPGRR
jgi:hypothetical protein